MPDVIQPAAQHQLAPGVCHNLLDLRQLWLGIAVGAAMFAGRLLGFQRAVKTSGNGIGHERGALGAHPAFATIFREQVRVLLHPPMFPVTVDLDKLPDQADIFFLLSGNRFHAYDNLPYPPNLT